MADFSRTQIQDSLERFVIDKNKLVLANRLTPDLFDEIVVRWIERNVPTYLRWIGENPDKDIVQPNHE